MKDGKRIELELPCSVTADAEGKVILYNDTLTEDDRGLIVSTRGITAESGNQDRGAYSLSLCG